MAQSRPDGLYSLTSGEIQVRERTLFFFFFFNGFAERLGHLPENDSHMEEVRAEMGEREETKG